MFAFCVHFLGAGFAFILLQQSMLSEFPAIKIGKADRNSNNKWIVSPIYRFGSYAIRNFHAGASVRLLEQYTQTAQRSTCVVLKYSVWLSNWMHHFRQFMSRWPLTNPHTNTANNAHVKRTLGHANRTSCRVRYTVYAAFGLLSRSRFRFVVSILSNGRTKMTIFIWRWQWQQRRRWQPLRWHRTIRTRERTNEQRAKKKKKSNAHSHRRSFFSFSSDNEKSV